MLVLASNSPRRQELIKLISADVKVCPADIDETVPSEIETEASPGFLAVKKAAEIAKKYPNDTVIGADTSVIVDGIILGKPKNDAEAFSMLSLLSGKTHKVITGCAVFKNGRSVSFSETTEVTFYALSKEEIENYIITKEPFDKAGAYGIQGYGSLLIEKINGDYFNVVGLPVSRLNKILKRF